MHRFGLDFYLSRSSIKNAAEVLMPARIQRLPIVDSVAKVELWIVESRERR